VAAYGLINFCVFHVSLTKSPSWRPKYQYYNRWLSLAGTLLCFIVMFMMDWKTALATCIIIVLLCMAIQKNKPDANWGSSTQSQTFLSALKGIHNLTKVEEHIKNYRPKVKFLISFCKLLINPYSL
jgi:solute carrier family 12 sodium/potassium/chloride transporter 2